ncbi:hypothetical protein [Sediminibacillus massiliensis]|uniref:hypothetical protein n=1 Tax=Sediminibacillus massiliensis TaxID=1926277 RepID=UPI0009883145|nr:hypothetical protein [Sediminibacillus massiliensis]
MGELIDFDKIKTKKRLKQIANEKGIVYEIYLTVVKYVYKYANTDLVSTSEFLTTEADLYILYGGNKERFNATFAELVQYWDLAPLPEDEVPDNQEFERFPTIGDLCTYIEKKVNKRKNS